jgi:hypothetical protein
MSLVVAVCLFSYLFSFLHTAQLDVLMYSLPIPAAERSQARVCSR